MTGLKFKVGLVAVVLGLTGLLLRMVLPDRENSGSLVKLNASVAFDGTRFWVSNNDTVDYLDAQLAIDEYYKITGMNLRAGETYTFWPVEFAHINGRRFPAKQKPQHFSIWCGLIGEANGFYSVKLNVK